MFGAGGGTSSYLEVEETDVILLWGSNAREAHPIYFHHVLKGLDNGARMFAVDPRRTSSAKFADAWLGLNVGTDVAMANAIGREIIAADLHNKDFIAHSSQGFEDYKAHVEPYTLEYAEAITGVPAEAIREVAHAYASAEKAQILWTLGITEHHNGVDNVKSLCNLALLTGHIGRWGSGLVPLRGQNNVQGGGDMGALPNKFPGFQDITNPDHRAKFEAAYGMELNPNNGKHLTLMLEAMEHGETRRRLLHRREPGRLRGVRRPQPGTARRSRHPRVQDIFMTATAQLADVVLPSSVGWAEGDGTVTSSERRVRNVHAAVTLPGACRHDHEIIGELAKRMGVDSWATQPRRSWDELAVAVAAPRRHELRTPRSRGRTPVAVSPEITPVRRSCTAGCGRTTSAAVPRRRSRSPSTRPERAVDRTNSAAPDHGSFARLLQHRCPVRWFREPDSQR